MTEHQDAPADDSAEQVAAEVSSDLSTSDEALSDADDAEGSTSPYRNLFIPLVLVPAMIVIVLVLVFVLFGQIAGDEKSMAQNLDRVQHAGANERDQALFHLVQQVEENWMALQAGEELPWTVEGDVSTELGRVWDQTPPDDIHFRYVLAASLTQIGDPTGLDKLMSCLAIDPVFDPEGTIRFNVLIGLGVAGGEADDAKRERVIEAVLPFLESEDLGLQLTAAGALQNLPGETSRAGLRELLRAEELELRGQAAVSLSHLGDPASSEVLWELVDRTSYDRAREADPEKYRREAHIVAVRQSAVAALVRLGRPSDLARLEEIAMSDSDLDVREAAMKGLASLEEGTPSE